MRARALPRLPAQDAHVADWETSRGGWRQRFVAPRLQIATASASLLVPLNSTLIAVGLPEVRHHFGVGVGALTWLVSSYLIAVAVSQPLGGRLGDRFGHATLVTAGLVVLLGTSLAAGSAWSFEALIAFRALQGVGAAFIAPNCSALLRKRVPPSRLGLVLGTNGAAVSSGAMLGPAFGGALLIAGDWRWLFFGNVPASLFALLLMLRLERDSGDRSQPSGIDLPSLLSLGGAFAGLSLLGAAIRLDNSAALLVAALFLPASVGAYLVLFRARNRGVVDLRLFSRRSYAVPAVSVALGNLVMYSMLVSIPVYARDIRDSSDGTVSALLFLMSAGTVILGPVAGGFADRVGTRLPILAGSVILVISAAGLAAMIGTGPALALALPLGLVGAGLGVSQAALSSAALQAWPPAVAGSASGTFSMMRYVGSITGVAIIAAILGAHPDVGSFRVLYTGLIGFALANVAVAWLIEPGIEMGPHVRTSPSERRSG